ncbi:hypothetical protein [Nocardia sp. NPDC020380]|uniref:hypothetical protein n=1 Tax=Nocardia sp. NPDC020380 TaxID=3364309 RepID=UPI003792EECE
MIVATVAVVAIAIPVVYVAVDLLAPGRTSKCQPDDPDGAMKLARITLPATAKISKYQISCDRVYEFDATVDLRSGSLQEFVSEIQFGGKFGALSQGEGGRCFAADNVHPKGDDAFDVNRSIEYPDCSVEPNSVSLRIASRYPIAGN